MRTFIEAASDQSIQEVTLILATVDRTAAVPEFYQARGGPLCIKLEQTSFVFDQPEGQEVVRVNESSVTQWVRDHPDPDYDYGVFCIFEIACYRLDAFCPAPFIDEIVGYRPHNETTYAGLILRLSTGGSIGVEASSDAGLRYFFDGHRSLFEEGYVAPSQFKSELLWRRTDNSNA